MLLPNFINRTLSYMWSKPAVFRQTYLIPRSEIDSHQTLFYNCFSCSYRLQYSRARPFSWCLIL